MPKAAVASSQKHASEVGAEVIREGGNATDASIAMAAVLALTEPTGNGLGSDAFAIVQTHDGIYGLNASGACPKKLSLETFEQKNLSKIPKRSWESVTIPGMISGWYALHDRFGSIPMKELLEPARKLAADGFEIAPITLKAWRSGYKNLSEANSAFKDLFKISDPRSHRNPDFAQTLEILQREGREGFYQNLASQIVSHSDREGGYFSMDDFSEHQSEWVDPISIDYRGYAVWELPANTQGVVALEALGILNQFEFDRPENWHHLMIESLRASFQDAYRFVTDPKEMSFQTEKILNFISKRTHEISPESRQPKFQDHHPEDHGTVYLCASDSKGMSVSLIQSNFWGFGSGMAIPNTGIALQNRGYSFSLNPAHVNVLKPGKKPFHTIIPGFLSHGSTPLGPFGIMGGDLQPQAHVQVLSAVIDENATPQEALDRPRWKIRYKGQIAWESELSNQVRDHLGSLGHPLTELPGVEGEFGGGQMIVRAPDGDTLSVGSDVRKDGCAIVI